MIYYHSHHYVHRSRGGTICEIAIFAIQYLRYFAIFNVSHIVAEYRNCNISQTLKISQIAKISQNIAKISQKYRKILQKYRKILQNFARISHTVILSQISQYRIADIALDRIVSQYQYRPTPTP